MEPCKPEGSYYEWFMKLKEAGYLDEVPIPNSTSFTFDVNENAPSWVWEEFPKVHDSPRARARKANE